MNWEVIFRPESLALFGQGVLTTLALLGSSLAVGGVLVTVTVVLAELEEQPLYVTVTM